MQSWSPTSFVIVEETISAQQREQSVSVRALRERGARLCCQRGRAGPSGFPLRGSTDRPSAGGHSVPTTTACVGSRCCASLHSL
jgi:hypothetical protein